MTSRSTRRIVLSLALAVACTLGASAQTQGAGLSLGGLTASVPAAAAAPVLPSASLPVNLPAPLGGGEPSPGSGTHSSAPAATEAAPPALPVKPQTGPAPRHVEVTAPPLPGGYVGGGYVGGVNHALSAARTSAGASSAAAPSAPSAHPGAINPPKPPLGGGGGSAGGGTPKVHRHAAAWSNHAHASAVALKQPASAPAGSHGQGPPSRGAKTPPGASSHSPQALAPLAQHRVQPASPAPNPLGGLTLQSETGQAMLVVLITLAAMLLAGVLFHEELGLRARQLVDRITQRPNG